MGGCALQPAYQRPALPMPAAWSNAGAGAPQQADAGDWWKRLNDPAVDQLVSAGLSDNPTLAEAAARVDLARAALGLADAEKPPKLGVAAGAAQSRQPAGTATTRQSAADIGASLSWEIDLWGRVRASSAAAHHRLTARTAEAGAARLSVAADIADAVLALRACNLLLDIRERDIASRETELEISRARLTLGSIAPARLATAQSNLASARTDRIAQEEVCTRLVDALVALSGVEAADVRKAMQQTDGLDSQLPEPPPFVPELPATLLLGHPSVIAAEREVAARWSDIAVARAERLPRLDLAAALTGQWIRVLGSNAALVSGSAGAALTGSLLDGGAGAANVRGAEAAYREAVAQLAGAVRAAVRDIEDGLAARRSADQRIETTVAALTAARFAMQADEARWRAGAIAQYELEDSRRQYNRSQESVIVAMADRARAWVMLVRRSGTSWNSAAAASGQAGLANGSFDERG
ncbi:efflux transporter outer membrane subunit [Sandaracinobacter neustonicus]|uniref:Efflux transporter outer membrane subunit n=1 Tax=Sandaracinobacter neustonicus TaxID=1715348 RepID=A0A501XTY4_9SPHN|nr:efflux transporter outer membrane subunit [Sandaracinobacter neustonicus]